MGRVIAVCSSKKKGTPKQNIKEGILKENYGLVGDAHAGCGVRQVSLLAKESLDRIEKEGIKLTCGGFGENITTVDIELASLLVGVRLKVGEALLEVSQIGKDCKRPCEIYKIKGRCILPSEGIFAKVIKGGRIKEGDLIEVISDKEIRVGVVIVSDRRAEGIEEDLCGKVIEENLINAQIIRYKIISDEYEKICKTLEDFSDRGDVDLILTCGGTGFSPRDVTPEATKHILEKEAPGLVELLRLKGAEYTPYAYLSRQVAGIRKNTLIINLPGSPKAVKENIEVLLPLLGHAIKVMKGKVKNCHKS